MKIKKADKIIILMTLILALTIYGMVNSHNSSEQRELVVQIGQEVVYREDLDNEGMYSFDVELMNKEKATIQVKQGSVRVEKMDPVICPKGICSATGWIDNRYQSIVCLPNQLYVMIEEEKENKEEVIDSISS